MFSKRLLHVQIIVILIAFMVFAIGIIGNIRNIGEFDGQLSVNLYKSLYKFEIIELGNRTLYYSDIRNIATILLVVIALPISIGSLLPSDIGFSLSSNINRKICLQLAMIISLLLIIVSVYPLIMVYAGSDNMYNEKFLIDFFFYSGFLGIITMLVMYIMNFMLLIASCKYFREK